MKKRIFTFPEGMPDEDAVVEHLLVSLAAVAGKNAPDALQGAKIELIVDTDGGQHYRALSFIE